MKKLLKIFLSVLMVLSVGMAVNAEGEDEGVSVLSSGPSSHAVGVRYVLPGGTESSNEVGTYNDGDAVTITVKDIDGYVASDVYNTVYSNLTENQVDFTWNQEAKTVTLTMSSLNDADAKVVFTIEYKANDGSSDTDTSDSEKVETGDNVWGVTDEDNLVSIAEEATGVKTPSDGKPEYSTEQAPLESSEVDATEKALIEAEVVKLGGNVDNIKYYDVTATAVILDVNSSVIAKANSATNKKLRDLGSSSLLVGFNIPDELRNTNDDIYIIRVHDGESTTIKAEKFGPVAAIWTNKFSTYALTSAPKQDTTTPSTPTVVTPTNTETVNETKEETTLTVTESTKSYSKKDKNHDGVVTCDEEMNDKNWVWNNAKGACVYKVTNTSAK